MTETKLALVTGTSRGIGEAVANRLLNLGWRVRGLSRGPAAKSLEREGYSHKELDLSDLKGLARWFKGDLSDEWKSAGRLGLVNNAGLLSPLAPLHRADAVQLGTAYLVNAAAPSWLMGACMGALKQQPLCIVNLSSGAATSPYSGWGAYCGSKAALVMAGRVAAQEASEVEDLKGKQLAIVSYAPGVVDTGMQAAIRASDTADFPHKQKFVELWEGTGEAKLVDPELPAGEIAELLESSDLPLYSELRFDPNK